MATTNFVTGTTITSDWLNDVDAVVYDTGTLPASSIANTPAGNIAATNVQTAINELDSEKQPLDTTLTSLAGMSVPAANLVPISTGVDAFGTITVNKTTALSTSVVLIPTEGIVKTYVDSAVVITPLGYNPSGAGITSLDFTIPNTTTREISIIFSALSTNGTNPVLLRLGDSSGVYTDALYYGALSVVGSAVNTTVSTAYTTSFIIDNSASAATTLSGTLVLSRATGGEPWTISGSLARIGSAHTHIIAGSRNITGPLTMLRITATGDEFDVGGVNVFCK